MSADTSRKVVILLLAIFFCNCRADSQKEELKLNSTDKNLRSKKSKTSPVAPLNYEYLRTPNFDCLLIPEDEKNAHWQKYASLFDPPRVLSKTTPIPKTNKTKPRRKRLQNAGTINKSNQISTDPMNVKPCYSSIGDQLPLLLNEVSDSGTPSIVSISLERRIVEAMFELLEKKNHIIVLQPRHCQPDDNHHDSNNAVMIKNDRIEFRSFAQSLLQKLMQQLKGPKSNMFLPSQGDMSNVDPVVQRILDKLDHEEEILMTKISKDLMEQNPMTTKNSRGKCVRCQNGKITRKRNTEAVGTNNGTSASLGKSPSEKMLHKDCDKGYIFLLGRHNDENKDLLMRAIQVENKKK